MKTYLDMDEILRHSHTYIGKGYHDDSYLDLVSAVPEEVIRSLPPANVVEVVRCRECFYNAGESRDLWGNPVILCVTAVKHEPDWYCASGKRKDGGRTNEADL